MAVYGDAGSATAVKGYSVGGLGVDARSTNNSALKASIILGANPNPVILATHAGAGIGVDASSNTGNGMKGTSNSGVGVRGESSTGTGLLGYSNSNTGVSAGSLTGTALIANSTSGYGLEVQGKLKISGGNTSPSAGAVLTSIDASGNAVWKQNRNAFNAEGVNSNYVTIPHSVYRRIHYGTTNLYDMSGSYQLLVGTNVQANSSSFIVPISGIYHFDMAAEIGGINYDDEPTVTQAELRLQRNRNGAVTTIATNSYPVVIKGGYYSNARLAISKDFFMEAGDIIYTEIYHKNATSQIMGLGASPYTYFNGHLVKAL